MSFRLAVVSEVETTLFRVSSWMLESTAFPNGAMRWLILLLAVGTMDVPNSSLMVELKERLEEFKKDAK